MDQSNGTPPMMMMNGGEKVPLLPLTYNTPIERQYSSGTNNHRPPVFVKQSLSEHKMRTEQLLKPKITNRARKNVGAFRRKRRDYDTWRGRVGVHVEVDSIDLKLLETKIRTNLPSWDLIDHYDVIRLWHPPLDNNNNNNNSDGGAFSGGEETEGNLDLAAYDASTPEVYIFSFGATVFWNFMSADSERQWLKDHVWRFEDAIGAFYQHSAIEDAYDEMGFCYGDIHRIHRDVVELVTRQPGEKLAVSFAFAKSALLSVFEWRLERTIERNAHIPEELANTGHITMSRDEISKEIGRIYLVKHGINLENNIIDTPEEFWEDDRFQDQYNKGMNYFDVHKRLGLVNTRLQVMQDLHQVLMEAVQNHHGAMLEWIVIILILVEVFLEVFRKI